MRYSKSIKAIPSASRFSESISIPAIQDPDAGWSSTSVGSGPITRDMPRHLQEATMRAAFTAYRANGLGNQLIELQIAFVMGNGVSIRCKHEPTANVLMEFWTDPYNAWGRKMYERLRDLFVFGEWLLWPGISRDGKVYIRDLMTDLIEGIIPDSQNHSEVDTIVLKRMMLEGQVSKNQKVPTIRRRLQAEDANWVKLDDDYTGDMFYFGLNRTSGAMRGVSELFTIVDYLNMYDEMLFARAEKVIGQSRLYWDLQLMGFTQSDIDQYMLDNGKMLPPRPGTVHAHNENVILTPKTADFRADDHVKDVDSLKSVIVSSKGFPGTWFDSPGAAGRAVGAEMAEPAVKRVVTLQRIVGEFLCTIFDYVLWTAEKHGTYTRPAGNNDRPYSIGWSRPSARDFQRTGPALARLAQFVDSTLKQHIMSPDEVRVLTASIINQLGLSDDDVVYELPMDLDKYHKDRMAQLLVPMGTPVGPDGQPLPPGSTGAVGVVGNVDPVAQRNATASLENKEV